MNRIANKIWKPCVQRGAEVRNSSSVFRFLLMLTVTAYLFTVAACDLNRMNGMDTTELTVPIILPPTFIAPATVGEQISTITFTSLGGTIAQCTQMGLPAGLELEVENTSCAINGTPTEASSEPIDISVTARNAAGLSSPAMIRITINPAAAAGGRTDTDTI